MRVISAMNHKGGVGKTTTIANLAVLLANAGRKITCIDLDPQQNLSTIFEVVNDSENFIDKSKETRVENLVIMPGREIIMPELDFDYMNMIKTRINALDSDYVLIDTPPTMTYATRLALYCSTDIIVPIELTPLALHGLRKLLESVTASGYDLDILGVLPTKVLKNRIAAELVQEQLPEEYTTKAQIPFSEDVNKGYIMNKAIAEVDEQSKVVIAFKELIKELNL